MPVKRVIVAGGRDFDDYPLLAAALDRLLERLPEAELVSGHARGADRLGERYAGEHGLPCAVFPADWKRFGRRAGSLRNAQMLEYAAEAEPVVIAFWDGVSRGTADMIGRARAAGVECIVIPYGESRTADRTV